MFKLLALFAVLVGVIGAASDADWAVFKAKHGKSYTQVEEPYRRMIYEDNLKKIQNHNELFAKGLTSFYTGENEYTDMTHTEFVNTMNGYRFDGVIKSPKEDQDLHYFKNNSSLPKEVDWVKKGYVTWVKYQGQCGSCWAFSSTGAIEGAHFKATGKLVVLSEKNLMDCTQSYGNKGCHGGWMDNSFRYVIANKGIDTDESYPYEEWVTPYCMFKNNSIGATISSFVDVTSGSESKLQEATADIGPISVAIDASGPMFQHYQEGVYDQPDCSTTKLDHAVLVAGYGTDTDTGKDYWLVKNSWGTRWGISGYVKMSRNANNQCGIATKASYPIA